MSRAWSPPLDVHTRTLTTLSVIRARPEHLKAIHDIQALAYPGLSHFYESPEVFLSKLEAYPAGNFIALATTSVVTDDDTVTWDRDEHHEHNNVHEDREMQDKSEGQEEVTKEKEDEDIEDEICGITVVEITETGPDGATATATSTTLASGESHISIVRARTPDILEGDDEDYNAASSSSSGLWPGHPPTRRDQQQQHHQHQGHSQLRSNHKSNVKGRNQNTIADQEENEDYDDNMTTVLFQWEEPVGYLFSHPYSRESVTLHRFGGHTASTRATEDATATTAARNEPHTKPNDPFEHDQLMEKYYIHDCAIHPAWQGKGLASRLFKALEESLIPGRNNNHNMNLDTDRQDLVDTEEDEDDGDMDEDHGEVEQESQMMEEHTDPPHHHHLHHHSRHRRKGRRLRHRKGAPNLKEIVLVSVLGSRSFWERTGGFQVVTDHDIDLSIYGDGAFFMAKPFTF